MLSGRLKKFVLFCKIRFSQIRKSVVKHQVVQSEIVIVSANRRIYLRFVSASAMSATKNLLKRNKTMKKFLCHLSLFVFLLFSANPIFAQAESPEKIRKRGLEILSEVKSMVEERYYDPNYRGIDLEKNFKSAKEQIKKAERNGQIYGIIAQFLLDFDDSSFVFSSTRPRIVG